MTKRDWLTIGIKLLGVYCAIWGFATLSYSIPGFLALLKRLAFVAFGVEVTDHYTSLFHPYAFQPIAYFLVGFLLIRKTNWCVNKIQTKQEDHSEQNTGNDSE